MLCQYKDIFGAPRTGAHSYRVFDIAIVDTALTAAAAYYISRNSEYSFPVIFSGLFVLGIGMHRLFCVDTAFLQMLRK